MLALWIWSEYGDMIPAFSNLNKIQSFQHNEHETLDYIMLCADKSD